MHYSKIDSFDVNNGPGIRVSLFVSGCRIHCPDCFNKITWDFDFGHEFTQQDLDYLIACLSKPYISGLSVLGGEPFEYENQKSLVQVLRTVHKALPSKNIWCFSGYLFDKDIMPKTGKQHFEMTDELLSYIDVLVDGPFIKDKKLNYFDYRGSDNQRIIEVKESLAESLLITASDNRESCGTQP